MRRNTTILFISKIIVLLEFPTAMNWEMMISGDNKDHNVRSVRNQEEHSVDVTQTDFSRPVSP